MYLLACEIALITDRQKSVKNNVFHQYAHYDGLTRQTKGRRLNKCNSANTQPNNVAMLFLNLCGSLRIR